MCYNYTKPKKDNLYLYLYLYLYISKNWSVAFIIIMLQLSYISIHVIFFYTNFSIIAFNIFFLIFTLLQPFSLPYLFISPLLLQLFSLPYLFISLLPSKLISFFLFPFIFLYFCLFLFTFSYYKFVVISSILCITFPHNKKVVSFSLKLLVDFFSCISTLGW